MPFLRSSAERGAEFGDRHDLVVVAVHDERRHADDLQVFGEVGLREGLDAVMVGLGAAHHALAPPVPDDTLGCFGASPVEAVEGPTRDIEVELRAIGRELPPEAVEHLDGQPGLVASAP